MKRKRQKKIENPNPYTRLFILLVISLLLLVIFQGYSMIKQINFKVSETPKSETKKVPIEVRQNLNPNYQPTYKVPVLLYHYVEYVSDKSDATRESLNINPSIFELQVKTLRENGYTFLTTRELGEALDGKRAMPKKPVLLTFDDGHWDVDTVVLPILKKYHAKATAYVITGFINGSDFLTDKQVEDLIGSGLVEIGAHTVHHVSLKNNILPLVDYEVNQSKSYMEKKYHIKVDSFAYPDGAFDQQAIDTVKSAGFTTAVSTIPGLTQSKQNRYFLFRLRPGRRTGKELLEYFNQTIFKPY